MKRESYSYLSLSHVVILIVLLASVVYWPTGDASASNGNDVPHEAKGFQKSSYALSDYETINLANGNLTWRLPIQTLRTNGGLSYDLALYYNSKIWYKYSYCSFGQSGYQVCPDSSVQSHARVADGIGNYGFGWDLRPPRIYVPRGRFLDERHYYFYVDQAGGRHSLHDEYPWGGDTPADVLVTRDGTNLRITITEYDNAAEPVAKKMVMEDGNGIRYYFHQVVPKGCEVSDGEIPEESDDDLSEFNFRMEVAGLYLKRIEKGPWDSSNGAANSIEFEYRGTGASTVTSETCSAAPNEQWLVEALVATSRNPDGSVSTRRIDLDYDSDSYLEYIDIPGFDPTLGGTQENIVETVTFSTVGGTYRQSNGVPGFGAVNTFPARTLTGVHFPDGSMFSFVPASDDGQNTNPVGTAVLPSGAEIEYSRGDWVIGFGKEGQLTTPCDNPTLKPVAEEFGAEGGTGSIIIEPDYPVCNWQAVVSTGSSWITLDLPSATGQGDGQVKLTVAQNDGASRTGWIHVNRSAFEIVQLDRSGGSPSTGSPPDADEPVWLTCGTPSARPNEGQSTELGTRGITSRTIEYQDAAGDRTQKTFFSNHLTCSLKPIYSDLGGVWPYDFRYALGDIGEIVYPEYLWTLVFTTGDSGDGEDFFPNAESTGTAEIHRFHPRTFEEFSADRLTGSLGKLFVNTFGMSNLVEDFASWQQDYGIRRLRHKEIERELRSGTSFPQHDGANINYSFIKSERSYSPDLGANPSTADIGNVGGCYENFNPFPPDPASFEEPDPPTCPTVVSDRVLVDGFLNPTSLHLYSSNYEGTVSNVEKWTTTTYLTDDWETNWYLHRNDSETTVEPGCVSQTGCSEKTTIQYCDLSSDANLPDFRVKKTVLNPDSDDDALCDGDCIERTFVYDTLGNLETKSVAGGFGAGYTAPTPTIHFDWAHGSQVKKTLVDESTGEFLVLWEREADPNTGLYRWHLDGSGAGYAYLYNEIGNLTDIAPIQKVWDQDQQTWMTRLQTLEDGTTPLNGSHIEYAYPASGSLLEHKVYDATWEEDDIDLGTALEPGNWLSTPLRSSFAFDGLGRLTQEKQRFPGGGTDNLRSRFVLDFFFDSDNSDDSSICNTSQQPWDLSPKSRVRIESTWREGTNWPNQGCGDAGFHWTETQLDALGRPGIVRLPDNKFVTKQYWGDAVVGTAREVAVGYDGGHVLEGRSKVETYDALGRLRILDEQVSADSNDFERAVYDYDHADRLILVSLNASTGDQLREFVYSPAGFLWHSIEPERYTTFTEYDALGNVRREFTRLDASSSASVETSYTFDEIGRPTGTAVGSSDVPVTELEYGDEGDAVQNTPSYNKVVMSRQHNRFSDESLIVEHNWSYDGPGNRVSDRSTGIVREDETGGIGVAGDVFDLSYSYDVWGNVDQIIHPSWSPWASGCQDRIDVAMTATFDGEWLTGVALSRNDDQNPYAEASFNGYSPNGRPVETTFKGDNKSLGRQRETPDGYDMARPAAVYFEWESSPDSGVYWRKWDQTSFAYDGSGNVIGFDVWDTGSQSSETQAFVYDGLNRLTEFHYGQSAVVPYEYDRYGNLTNLGGTDLDIDGLTNRLEKVNTVTIPESAWDPRGNLKWIPGLDGDGEKSLTYSPEDRLLETEVSGSTWRYAYDAAGERVVSWLINGGDTQEARITIRDEAGQTLTDWLLTPGALLRQRDYLYAGSRMVTQIDWSGPTGVRRFAATDHLGSTRFLIGVDEEENALASTEQALEFLPFGTFKVGDSTADTTHLFTGHERDLGDNLSGLDYMHARYYSPNLGRFMSVDPVGGSIGSSQSWNRYSYVLNNPLKLIDPDGEAPHGALTEMKIREGMTLAEVEQFNEIQQQVERPAAMVALAFMPGPDDALMAVALGTRATRALGSLGRAIKGLFSKGDAAVDAAKPIAKAVDGKPPKTAGLRKQLEEHIQRLEDYKANPDKHDNKGLLKDASPERRKSVIEGRIRNLEGQIADFRKQIEKAEGSQ